MSEIAQSRPSTINSLRYTLAKLRYRTDIILSIIFIVLFGFLVLVPLVKIIITSLTYQDYDLRVVRGARLGAFTLYHYLRVFTGNLSYSLFVKPFINSLLVGFGVTVIAMILGSLLAWAIVRTDIPWKKFLDSVIVIPYMMPSWVIALAWIIIFKNNRIAGEEVCLRFYLA